MGRLEVTVVEARNLPDVQTIGTIDPYVRLKVETTSTAASKVVPNQTSPQWNEVFKFDVADESSAQLSVEVWNSNVTSDDFLGGYSVSLAGLVKGEVKDEWYLLQQCQSNAEIHLRLLAVDFGRVVAPPAVCQAAPLPVAAPQPQAYPAPQQPPPPSGAQPYPAQPYVAAQAAYPSPGQPYVAPPPEKPQTMAPSPAYGAPAQPYGGPTYGQPQAPTSPPPSAYGQNSAHYQPPAAGAGAPPQWPSHPPPVQALPVQAQPVQGRPVGPSRTGLAGFLNGMVAAAGNAIDSVHQAVRAQTEGQKRQANHRAIYVNDVDGFHFLLADHTLRHIPDGNVFSALFNRPMDATGSIHFSTAPGSPPPPYPFGTPLPPFCRIIHFNSEFYLVDDLGGGPPCRRHLNLGAWNQFNLVAGSNVHNASLQEFQHLIIGPPLV